MALTNAQGNAASGDADFGNPVKVGARYNSVQPSLSDGQRTDLQTDSRGALYVDFFNPTDGAGMRWVAPSDGHANTIVGFAATARAMAFNGTTWDRQSKATAVARLPSAAATTNATVGKASAGTVYTIEAMNTTAAVKYLKLYNKATAPTVGTDTPFRTIALAPSNTRSVVHFPNGLYLNAGISFALTGAAADADATVLVAGDVVGVNIDYS